MQFIEDDELQILEKTTPLRVVRQHAFVKHVGIAENDVSSRTDRRAGILRRVAIVSIDADSAAPGKIVRPLHEIIQLIVGERFRRIQTERPRVGIFQMALKDRKVVAERLAGGGGRNDHDILAAARQIERLRLMRIELLDSATLQRALEL